MGLREGISVCTELDGRALPVSPRYQRERSSELNRESDPPESWPMLGMGRRSSLLGMCAVSRLVEHRRVFHSIGTCVNLPRRRNISGWAVTRSSSTDCQNIWV